MVGTNGKPHSTTMYSLTWLSTAGTLLLISGVIVALVLKVGAGRAVAAYGKTLYELRWAILTVAAVLGAGLRHERLGTDHRDRAD